MKRIILFRFHQNFSICKNRIQMLKKFNPGIDIYGLFGGQKSSLSEVKKALGRYLKNIYYIPVMDSDWKWKNGDLSLRMWFKDIGRSICFDVLYSTEWDLIIFESLSEIYKNIPKEGIGLTGLMPLQKVQDRWKWTSKEPHKSEWNQLQKFIKKMYGNVGAYYGSLGPGSCFPRKFLEEYSNIEVPELCHEEIRVPLFVKALKFKLYSTGFYKQWFDPKQHETFNCIGQEINLKIIKSELSFPAGIRVFHPYFKKISSSMLRIKENEPA